MIEIADLMNSVEVAHFLASAEACAAHEKACAALLAALYMATIARSSEKR